VESEDEIDEPEEIKPPPTAVKVVYSISAPVSIWPLEWDISVPVNTGVPFRVYRKYIYIYIDLLLYTFIHQNL
jgi:hypothetical protein